MLERRIAILPVPQPQAAQPTATADADPFAGGAGLKTDPELERLLERAGQFARDGRFDLASTLWQSVLDRSSDMLVTREEWTYETFQHKYQKFGSVPEEIEHALAGLDADSLKLYRISADGQAQAILAGDDSGDREKALSDVVRRFFLSSLGDDAAFELA